MVTGWYRYEMVAVEVVIIVVMPSSKCYANDAMCALVSK